MYDFPILGTFGIPVTTAASGTYGYLIPPMKNAWTGLQVLDFTIGATAEVGYVLRPIGLTHTSSAAAAGQKVINVNADPGVFSAAFLAAGAPAPVTADNPVEGGETEYCAYQMPDGTWVFDIIASISTLAYTMTTNNVPTGGLPAGSAFWFFGEVGDTNPYDAMVHPSYTLFVTEAKGALKIGADAANVPFIQSYGQNNPLLVLATSTTNQSWLEYGAGVYLQRPSAYWPQGNVPFPNK